MLSSETVRALLIRPWIEDFSAFDLWMRPLGLLRLATILRRLKVDVSLFDCLDRYSPLLGGLPPPPRHRLDEFDCGHLHREEIEKPEILAWIPRRFKRHGVPLQRVEEWLPAHIQPDVIFVACMSTYWYSGAHRMIQLCKRLWPDVPVVLGGVYTLLCPDHAQQHSKADVVVTEPGWEAVLRAAARYLGSPSEKAITDACTEPIAPALDLLPSHQSLPVLTRSGCPFRCTYCASEHINPKVVAFPPDWVIEQILRALPKERSADVAFFDDALLLDPGRHSKPIFEGFARRRLPVRFHTPNALHACYIDRELAVLMHQAGVRTIRLGLESDDSAFQVASGGKVTTDEFLTAMGHLRAAGYSAREIGTYILVGLPGQPLDSVRRTAQFVHRLGSEVKFAMYSPTPRTLLFGNREGFRFDPSEEPLLQNDTLTPWRSTLFTAREYRALKAEVDQLNDLARRGQVVASARR